VSALFTVRRATLDDLESLVSLIEDFARGHPAEHYPRSIPMVGQAYFRPCSISRVFLAERRGEPVGFGAWPKVFDIFWAMYGGEMDGLYVQPRQRGLGVAPTIIAAICADIRSEGGCILRGTYTSNVGRLYERVAVASVQLECHVSATAFHRVADLADSPPRRLLRGLPEKRINNVAAYDADAG
jgi:GNAT superfamily N-acetyltransferase